MHYGQLTGQYPVETEALKLEINDGVAVTPSQFKSMIDAHAKGVEAERVEAEAEATEKRRREEDVWRSQGGLP